MHIKLLIAVSAASLFLAACGNNKGANYVPLNDDQQTQGSNLIFDVTPTPLSITSTPVPIATPIATNHTAIKNEEGAEVSTTTLAFLIVMAYIGLSDILIGMFLKNGAVILLTLIVQPLMLFALYMVTSWSQEWQYLLIASVVSILLALYMYKSKSLNKVQ